MVMAAEVLRNLTEMVLVSADCLANLWSVPDGDGQNLDMHLAPERPPP